MDNFYVYENEAWLNGTIIAGADEAGRGPLAGPVVAAAVIIPQGLIIQGINDSKKLSAKKREILYEQIISTCEYSIGIVDVDIIENINILNASRLAFKNAIEGLDTIPNMIYADYITNLDIEIPYSAIVKGDAKVYSIAAASIIAKVTRDRLMDEYAVKYPMYGFEKHKGYGTKLHSEAIKKYGPCPIHRESFLKKILNES